MTVVLCACGKPVGYMAEFTLHGEPVAACAMCWTLGYPDRHGQRPGVTAKEAADATAERGRLFHAAQARQHRRAATPRI